MNFLLKLEAVINQFLLKLGRKIHSMIPAGFFTFLVKLRDWFVKAFQLGKMVIRNAKPFTARLLARRTDVADWLSEYYKLAQSKYQGNKGSALKNLKAVAMVPFVMLSRWLSGLSALQSLLLLTFSAASILAVIGVTSSGQKIASHHATREPASIEEDPEYDRPGYYKEELRHFTITNFRLPVYLSELGELRSIDIDFTATMSNRRSRVFLEKQEFQLRDHLILYVEPMVASFPLEEEGKEIIRHKIKEEITEYLRSQGQEGEVLKLKLTYILAN